jgi:hypothetical protein
MFAMAEENNRDIQVTWEDDMWSDRTTCRKGSVVQLHQPPPTHPSDEFIGWFTKTSGGDKITHPFYAERNITVFARWKFNDDHVVTEKFNDATCSVKIRSNYSDDNVWT